MQVKTILNRIQKRRGFVYGTVQLEEQMAGLAPTVDIASRRRNRPRCAGCVFGGQLTAHRAGAGDADLVAGNETGSRTAGDLADLPGSGANDE